MRGGIIYMKNINALESYDIDPRHIINSSFVFNNSQYIDYEWIEKQLQYIIQLSDRQKHIVRSYTIYGDQFINNYLRNTLTKQLITQLLIECQKYNENPFMYQHYDTTQHYEIDDKYEANIYSYIHAFIKEFTDIINDSPKLTKKIKVFRGLSDKKYLLNIVQTNANNNKYIQNNDFISSSIYIASASTFMKKKCCLLELFVEPSVPCLFTAQLSKRRNEYEVTFPPGIVMKYIRCKKKFMLNEFEHYDNANVFIKPESYNISSIHMCEMTLSIALPI
jgi:hypothetical protein